ncbi:MAG: fibronectin type III domain-containing protein, partial [candidate division WOR-3 bacterium]|nr:fibronectin type III domain-containing protein [candidate division WOR-3 bacterium]
MTRKFIAVFWVIFILFLFFVNCEKVTAPSAPTNLKLVGTDNGLKVKLTWDAPTEATDGYYVYFKAAGSDTWQRIKLTGSTTTSYIHDPNKKTGDYKVTAYKGDEESDPTAIKTTIPKETPNITLNELNAAGNSGLGFTVTDGSAFTYSMTATDAASKVDF